jgi:hypothetical protein
VISLGSDIERRRIIVMEQQYPARLIKPLSGWRNSPSKDLLADVDACLRRYEAAVPGKSFASDDGWAFLIKDTGDFLRWQFGLRQWSDTDGAAADKVLQARVERVGERKAGYFFFVVPEKSVVFHEYLPGLLSAAPSFAGRPAMALHRSPGNNAVYLLDRIEESKRLGLPYFRGDTHPNWFGSWIVYRAIHDALSGCIDIGVPLGLESIQLTTGSYDGDLFNQLSDAVRADLPALFRLGAPGKGCEVEFVFNIRPELRKAQPGPVAEEYRAISSPRKALVWNNSDTNLPRCVVFRDSTAQFSLDLMAHHFSRMVAIWRGGHVIEEVIERERPDIVLQIQAERFIYTLPKAQPIVSIDPGV